jgi:hypothetical protein
MDKQLQALREEHDINEVKMREKDQDLKIAELRIKDLRRQAQIL